MSQGMVGQMEARRAAGVIMEMIKVINRPPCSTILYNRHLPILTCIIA